MTHILRRGSCNAARADALRNRRTRGALSPLAAAAGIAVLVGMSFVVPAAAASPATAPGNFGSTTVTTETLAGANLYATAIAVSKSLYPSGKVPVVYLVSGVAYADALAAGPAAAHDGGVVLYTGAASLPSETATELIRLAPARVVVVGGTSVIADSVMTKVVAILDPSTVVARVSGSDAAGTAAAISARSFRTNTGATYHAITPGRVLDSRRSLGASRFHSRVKQSFAVAGLVGIPSTAVAVTGNVAVVGQTRGGHVTIAPSLTSGVDASTSSINFPVGDVRANGLTVSLGVGGKLDAMYWAGGFTATANIVFDVTGYFANDSTGATFHSITPGRVLDSRISLGARVFHSRVKQSFAVAGHFGIPSTAVAVTGSVAVVGQTAGGNVTVAPRLTSGAVPSTSTINFPAGDTRANGITVALGPGGKLDAMYWSGGTTATANIVFDVTGYFAGDSTGATFHAITPGRVLDSRLSLGATVFYTKVKHSFAVAGHAGVPTNAVAVTGNVAVVDQTRGGSITLAPTLTSGAVPATSTINFPSGDIRASGITVPLGPGGKLDAMYRAASPSNAERTDIVFDVTGYFAKDPATGPYHASATVVIASDESYSDAIVAGSVAARLGVPFLLVTHNALPAATAAELRRLKPDHGIVVGNTTSVSDTVLAAIGRMMPEVERISGTDRYATASAVAARFFPKAATIIATSGLSYTGGLAAVPLSAANKAPILFTQGTDLLPAATRGVLLAHKPTRIEFVGSISYLNEAELVGFSDGRLTKPADTTTYPAAYAGYHDPGELYTVIKAEEIAYPTLVHVFSIGKSYQGRNIWAAKVSSDVSVDENKPETLVDALHHADEDLGVEQAIYLLETLTSQYKTDPYVNALVNARVTWIVFAVNPDGWEYDLSGGQFHDWRRNRQPAAGTKYVGTDINRNYGYQWGCCGGSSSQPFAWNYRGPRAFSTPEAKALANFVTSRDIAGKQRIKTQVSLHSAGGLILYPYSYTLTALPSTMKPDDHSVFVKMAQTMAGLNGYQYEQSSHLYLSDGDEIDWLYHTYGIFSFTIELYPASQGSESGAFYPPYSVVPAQTAKNRGMLLYVINSAACPYTAIGKTAQYCAGAPGIIPATGL